MGNRPDPDGIPILMIDLRDLHRKVMTDLSDLRRTAGALGHRPILMTDRCDLRHRAGVLGRRHGWRTVLLLGLMERLLG